jgi:deoxyribonuclease-4
MSAKYLGVHMPMGKGGLSASIRDAHKMGCTAIQVFTTSPRQWKSIPPTVEKIAEFKAAVRDTGLNKIISHDTYLVNLCHSDEELAAKSRVTLTEEIERCHMLGIGLVVSHIGALKERGQGEAFLMVAEQLKNILADTPEDVTLLMETTAGQGSSINSKFEEIAMVYELVGSHPRLGVCIDSCHLFAAGYDIRTEETYSKTMDHFDKVVGLGYLRAIHLNDSKKGFGSHVDRHDNLGKGEIGVNAFSYFVNDPRLENIPMVVETSTENEGHEKDLATLLTLRV